MNSIPSGTGGQTALSPDATERERAFWEAQYDRLRGQLAGVQESHENWKNAFGRLEKKSREEIDELRTALEFWKQEHAKLEAVLASTTKELNDGIELWKREHRKLEAVHSATSGELTDAVNLWKREHAAVEAVLQQWIRWYNDVARERDELRAAGERMHAAMKELTGKHEALHGAFEQMSRSAMNRAISFLRRLFRGR